MPASSHVHDVYEALLKKGHSKESAARIAQAQTGDSLKTGEPAKTHENMAYENGRAKAIKYLNEKYGI